MKMLRRLIGSKLQFRYVAEYIELLPSKQTKSYIKDIKIQQTNARRNENDHAFEY